MELTAELRAAERARPERVHLALRPITGDVDHADARGAVRAREGVIVEARLDGLRGLGEASPLPGVSLDDLASCVAALTTLGSALDVVLEPSSLEHELRLASLPPAARMGLETALLDLCAQRAGVSLAVLLSDGAGVSEGVRTQVLVPRGAAGDGAIARAIASGATALKLKVGAPGELTRDRMRIAEARAFRPDVVLRVDANEAGLPPDLVLALAAARIDFCEDPCPRAAALAHERTALPFPVALDAAVVRDADAALRAVREGRVAALVLKPTALGGLLRTRSIARAARASGARAIVSHALESPVAVAASAQLALALREDETHGLGRYEGLGRFRVGTWAIAVPEWLGRFEIQKPSTIGLGVEVGA